MIVGIKLPEGVKYSRKRKMFYFKPKFFGADCPVAHFFCVKNAQTNEEFDALPSTAYRAVSVSGKGRFHTYTE